MHRATCLDLETVSVTYHTMLSQLCCLISATDHPITWCHHIIYLPPVLYHKKSETFYNPTPTHVSARAYEHVRACTRVRAVHQLEAFHRARPA